MKDKLEDESLLIAHFCLVLIYSVDMPSNFHQCFKYQITTYILLVFHNKKRNLKEKILECVDIDNKKKENFRY